MSTIHDYETTVYNQCCLGLDPIPGVTVPGNPNPIIVPLRLTSYSGPTIKMRPVVVGTIPLINEQSNLGFGGSRLTEVVPELPKITLEGTIDSPYTDSGTYELPSITGDSGVRYTYPELILMQMEGRGDSTYGKRIRPRFFRDPYGRAYGDYMNDGSKVRPRIFDFKANYVEGAPRRTQFSLVLIV